MTNQTHTEDAKSFREIFVLVRLFHDNKLILIKNRMYGCWIPFWDGLVKLLKMVGIHNFEVFECLLGYRYMPPYKVFDAQVKRTDGQRYLLQWI